jgi:hypothetical protein
MTATLIETRFLAVVRTYQHKMQAGTVTEADRDEFIRSVLAVAQTSTGVPSSQPTIIEIRASYAQRFLNA